MQTERDKPSNIPDAISAKIQPTPHISTAVVYLEAPRRMSGGRYQRVTTSLVNLATGILVPRAKPKSANFNTPD